MINNLGTGGRHLVVLDHVVIAEHDPQQLVHPQETGRSRTHQVPAQHVQHVRLLPDDLFLGVRPLAPPLDVRRCGPFRVLLHELRADENGCVA